MCVCVCFGRGVVSNEGSKSSLTAYQEENGFRLVWHRFLPQHTDPSDPRQRHLFQTENERQREDIALLLEAPTLPRRLEAQYLL